ncbi:hypothetical protein BDR05DRAFT_957595 [Suillus weaverae]|nr:hypothetical protein BDR05DRAFT_957595 [Suillus weaverae]
MAMRELGALEDSTGLQRRPMPPLRYYGSSRLFARLLILVYTCSHLFALASVLTCVLRSIRYLRSCVRWTWHGLQGKPKAKPL